ncbi:uncharacterized protein LTR77_004769 [Saxophila tyrrhenica]|uniref:EamA domain-containing protein n=1 Tax=Saxophila tyrrhenica TaxID=1690608 RepID=A0AAV9PAD1_9PEZI|nr:hypothetical protein LTR77_004769 [Saxophila tyrrhenica]
MPRTPSSHPSSAIPLTSVPSASGSAGAPSTRPAALQPPDQLSPTNSARGSSSDLVHLSKETSRQGTPFSDLPDPDTYQHSTRDRSHGERESGEESSSFDLASDPNNDMPSDLRPSLEMEHKSTHHQPLLSGNKARQSYDSEARPGFSSSRRGSRFHETDPQAEAAKATRKRYTYAGAFLLVSLVSFAIQTETAVYVQHNLHWNKAYCMLYFTHGSWSVLYPISLLALRLQKWQQPWPQFWRRHVTMLRQTAQMVEHRTLHVPPHLQKKSPVPYFLYTTAYVTCALTVAGGSWYVAVNLTTASDLTAIYNCSAFFAYAFAVPMLHERVMWSKIVAVGVAILGVLIVAYGDQGGSAKHGSKSGGGAGGPDAPDDSEANNRFAGNLVIGVGSVLYGFYEVLYKKVACPPDGTAPGRGVVFANLFGTLIGVFTLSVLWIPLPILHIMGWETFELPRGEAAWMLLISVFANATFSGSFLVLISLTSPVLSSVAALLTIFLVALCDEMLPPPLYNPITAAAMVGGLMIIFAFLLLSWSTYREMQEESEKHADERVEGSDEDL